MTYKCFSKPHLLFLPVLLLFIPFVSVAQEMLLTIDDLFSLAERNSKSIRVSELAREEAEEAVRVSKNGYTPKIDFSASASYLGNVWTMNRNLSNAEKFEIPHLGTNFAVEAVQVIYAGGAIKSGVDMAKLRKQSADVALELNRQDVRFLLVGSYLELFKLYNQARVFKENISQTQRLVDDMRAREKAGIVLKNDITRYELQLKSLELGLTQVENGIVILNHRIVTTVGLPDGTVIKVDEKIADELLPEMTSESEWQKEAEGSSPVIKMSEIGVEQSKKAKRLITSEYIPSIVLFAGDQLSGPLTSGVPALDRYAAMNMGVNLEQNMNLWYVGVGLKYNFSSVYQTTRKRKQADFAIQKAQQQQELAKENINIAVKAAYTRYMESFTIFDTQKKSLELAEQNYSVVNNRYLNDLALITDMLDASNQKLNAELEVENSRINIIFHYYNLLKAVGKL